MSKREEKMKARRKKIAKLANKHTRVEMCRILDITLPTLSRDLQALGMSSAGQKYKSNAPTLKKEPERVKELWRLALFGNFA